MTFTLRFTKPFAGRYQKLIKHNLDFQLRIEKALECLSTNPFDFSLRTHKVNTRRYGFRYSSRVTGDLRIIWDFDPENRINLLLLDIGGHSGKRRVY